MQLKADISEEGLSLRCKQEDMNARRMLYERYGGALMAICLRYTGNREEAEDVLHDGFLHIEMLLNDIPDVSDEEDNGFDDIPSSVLMKMISELPDGYRTVFNLYVFEDKSHKEIASILGITEHTSSSQFYRAKSLLMKKINEYRNKELTR